MTPTNSQLWHGVGIQVQLRPFLSALLRIDSLRMWARQEVRYIGGSCSIQLSYCIGYMPSIAIQDTALDYIGGHLIPVKFDDNRCTESTLRGDEPKKGQQK